ncbi:MAG: translation initiation factor IF-2, partial [Bryobacteraceae bacterium]
DTRRHQGRPAPRVMDRDSEREGKLRPGPRRSEAPLPAINREITVAEGITVKELSEKLGVKANFVIKKLVERKIFATINQTLDVKLAEEISREFGASTNKVSYEQEATQEIELAEDTADLVRRAPVVTIMGHVDHGKTSLLDSIRSAHVADREAGGITQHIGAYHVEKNGRKIVFIDTPGHEAFTRMRARGASVTDIVILVVAADDGVMPQTLEAIDHAKAAKVPVIVAINKVDKPDAQPDRVKQQLSDRGLLWDQWGGDVVMVNVSAKAKTGLDDLLEMVLLVADIGDLKANPGRPAMGTVLEAQLDRGRGPVPTVLVRNGTLRVGDHFICGSVFGKVRAMFDDRGAPIREAEPSMPVEVLGLDAMPDVGDSFQVVTDTAKAKQIVIYREAKAREQSMVKTARMTLEQLNGSKEEELNIIIKADVGGTAEVLSDTLQRLSTDKVKVNILRAAVGAITEGDVLLASTSSAIIVGFNVRGERTAMATAEQEKVDIRFHSIIYELTDEIKKAMTGLLAPVYRDVYKGKAEVREVFRISKVGVVAGCMVLDGSITRDSQVRVLREGAAVHTGRVDTLKRFKNDASEVKQGFECGIALSNFNDLKSGDIIEAFVTERVAVEAMA